MSCQKVINLLILFLILIIPAQVHAEEWSIGIYEGDSPLSLQPAVAPVLTASDVTDISASFVADPFMILVNGIWYMYFEVLNSASNQGDIAYATSTDGLNWTYQQVVLDEAFHLSYPYVFEWQGEYYMVPETYQANAITLYHATSFPTVWEPVTDLVSGVYVDSSLFYHNGGWWMYAGGFGNDTLHLFYADSLTGPWSEHPDSPLIVGDANIARPGGRVLQFDGRLFRIAQDDSPSYGNQVRAFEVLDITRTTYVEVEAPESPLFGATGEAVGWNSIGMHNLDVWQLDTGAWLAVVDGLGDATPSYQNEGMPKTDWILWFVDSEELIDEDGAAVNAFDGDISTFWHTEWSTAIDPAPPHDIQIQLGNLYDVDGFRYIPRQDGGENGNILSYEFYVSSDGVNWGAAVASGAFVNDASAKEIRFPAVTGQYVRLRALSEVNGNPWTSVAELDVYGALSGGGINRAPNGVIDTPAQNMTIAVGDSVNFTATATDSDGDLPLSTLWAFGAGSGIADTTVEDPGLTQFNFAGIYTVSLLVTDAQGLADPTPATVTITVIDGVLGLAISNIDWVLQFVDSEELIGEDGAAVNAFDGDISTFWHTEWSTAIDPAPPHDIQIQLGNLYDVDGFRYIPRQDGGENGNILSYEFYVSSDGVNWGAAVASGAFVNDASAKEIRFPAVTGQYVRLRALSEVNGNPWTSVAELDVYGALSGGGINRAPNGVIDTPAQNMTIAVGDSVNFTATATDSDGDLPLSTLWAFGAGSGIADTTVEDPGLTQFNFAGIYTVSLLVTDAQGLADPTPATVTITVIDGVLGLAISNIDWVLQFVDSEELIGEDGAAVNAFDGDISTFWHTEWSTAIDPAPPHDIQIQLGNLYDVDGFRYIPRQDGGENGNILSYEFYVSSDGVNWGAAVASGAFVNDASAKEIRFPAVTGQYVRLRALSEVNGNPWTSVAELDVYGALSGGGINRAPNGVIDTPAQNMTIAVGDSVNFTATATDSDGDLPLSTLWAFDAGSGIADTTVEDPGLTQFNFAGIYTVSLLVTDAQGLADPTPATVTITVIDGVLGLAISNIDWVLQFVDSEELIGEDGAAVNAFDGDISTFWHTEWSTAIDPAPPHDIQIQLGNLYDVDGFRYIPRQDGGENGNILSYEFYVSSDGVNWGAAVASGAFVNDASAKEIRFPAVTGQYVRLRALSEVNGNPWTSVAEIDVFGFLKN